MTYMLCRNRVMDFAKWMAIFASHPEVHRNASLRLVNLWRDIEEPNNVFFLFEVADMAKARAFISSPESAKAGEVSGVIDGEIHFVEEAEGC